VQPFGDGGPRTHYYKPMIKHIQADITPVGEDSTGAVVGGFLLVEGSLVYIPAGSRESIPKRVDVKFDVAPEPVGDMYLLTLYEDAQRDYEGRRSDPVMAHYIQCLLLIPHEPDSSCLRRCGFAVPKRRGLDHTILQMGEHSGPEKRHRFRVF